MSSEARLAYTACVIFGLVGAGLAFAGVKLRAHDAAVLARSRPVEARVVGYTVAARAAVPTLRFETPDGRRVEAPAAAGVSPETIRVGGALAARYDPQNPRAVWVEGTRVPVISVTVTGIGLGTIVAAALAALLFRLTGRLVRTGPAPG